MNRSHLLEISQKVYNSQDSAEDRQGKKSFHAVIVAPREMDKRGNKRNRLGEMGGKSRKRPMCLL